MNRVIVLLMLIATVSFAQEPKARFATPQEPHNTISSESPDGWRPPVTHYDDSDFYTDPSKPHLRFYGKREQPKPEKKYPYWEKNSRGEDVLWVAPDDYYIREKEPDQQAEEEKFYAQLGRDFIEAAGNQSNLGSKKLLIDLQIHKEGMHRRVYLNRLFRRIADYEMSTLPN